MEQGLSQLQIALNTICTQFHTRFGSVTDNFLPEAEHSGLWPVPKILEEGVPWIQSLFLEGRVSHEVGDKVLFGRDINGEHMT